MQSIHTSATPPRSKLPNVKMHSVPRYPGVHFIYGKSANDTEEKIYYIRYRKDGKEIKSQGVATSVLRKTKDGWKIVQTHSSFRKAK